jgi:hypothetical protein
MVALSGETYRLYNEIHGDNPGEPSTWAYHKALHRAALEGRIKSPPPAALTPNETATAIELFGTGDLTAAVNALPAGQYDSLEDRFGLLADWVLIRQRIHVAPEDRRRFLHLVGTASLDAGWQLRRNSEGDYSPDPKAQRFPPIGTVTALKPKQTITGLVDLWWKEAKATGRSQNTYDTYTAMPARAPFATPGVQSTGSRALRRPGTTWPDITSPVAAAVLGGIERAVGGRHQSVAIRRGLRRKPRCRAQAHGDQSGRWVLRMEHGELVQRITNFLADLGTAI